jgi:hypothetical protein
MLSPHLCNRVSLPDGPQQPKQQDKDPQDSDGDEPEGVNAAADFDRQMRAELIRVSNTLSLCLGVGYIHCPVSHSYTLDMCVLWFRWPQCGLCIVTKVVLCCCLLFLCSNASEISR